MYVLPVVASSLHGIYFPSFGPIFQTLVVTIVVDSSARCNFRLLTQFANSVRLSHPLAWPLPFSN